MKPVAAIIESEAARDVVEVDAALVGYRDANRHYEEAEHRATTARQVMAGMRLRLGRALNKVRGHWPASGPKSRGWGDFLRERSLDQDVALEAMKYALHVDETSPGCMPGDLPTRRQAGLDPDDDTGPRIVPAPSNGSAAPFRQLSESDLVQALARLDPEARKRLLKPSANLAGGSGDEERGTWCTSEKWAKAVGPFDLDPFTNPRSKIASVTRCMLEDGGDGFGGVAPGSSPGLYLAGTGALRSIKPGVIPAPSFASQPISGVADAETRVWIQPPYEIVLDAIAHYGHTRFTALLRFSPDVEWFRRLWPLTCAVAIPLERMDFEPPPGIEKPKSSIPYPHALYYADERDITDEVRSLCIIWRVDHETRPPLHIVR